jgi:hypothetical protein
MSTKKKLKKCEDDQRYDTNTNNVGRALDKTPPPDQKNQSIKLNPPPTYIIKAYRRGPPVLSCCMHNCVGPFIVINSIF